MNERLVSAAIQRNGQLWQGLRSHYELRASRGDTNPTRSQLDDEEGFMTSTGRFLSRNRAVEVGVSSGQLPPSWAHHPRELLSSDINWEAGV